MMQEKVEEIEKICAHAALKKLRRGDAILCREEHGTGTPNPPPVLCEKDVCIATTFFSTGHANSDVMYDANKMYDCPYRKHE